MSIVLKMSCEGEVRRVKLAYDRVRHEDVLELVHKTWPDASFSSIAYLQEDGNPYLLDASSTSDFLGTVVQPAGQNVIRLQLVTEKGVNTQMPHQLELHSEVHGQGYNPSFAVTTNPADAIDATASSQCKDRLTINAESAVHWIDSFFPRAWTGRMTYRDLTFDQFPDPLSAVKVYLPAEVTRPFFKQPVSYTDCAECCLLRFVQLALFAQSGSSDVTEARLIDLDHAEHLGADLKLIEYFRCFPAVLSQEFTSSEARSAWATLVTRRAGCAYVRHGGFEMNAGVGNFLALLKSLFPKLPINEGVTARSDDGNALRGALKIVCCFFSRPGKKLSIANFSFVGPLWSRKKGQGGPLWTHPITHDFAQNEIAVDRETSMDVCVNDRQIYHFDLWDRHFLADGNAEEVTSGHAEMSYADPRVAWACGTCTFENEYQAITCAMCQGSRPGAWPCAACTFENQPYAQRCEVCSSARQ